MNTKQFFSAAAALVLCAASLNAKPTDARQGYFGLKWGTSARDAENAKHKLTRLPLAEEQQLQKANGYPESVMIYDIAPDSKKVKNVMFYYYNDRLFMVRETMEFDGKQKTLESRYGSFKDTGVNWKNGVYTDETRDADGNIRRRSLAIDTTAAPGMVSVTLCDWTVCNMLSDASKENSKTDNPFITEFKAMAQKLAPEKKSGAKPSYAVVTLTTDNHNLSIETYVTDALTEAVFDTGKVRIIERANLENILSEQQFQSSGLVNEDTAKAIGSIAGADYVCYGTIKDSGATLLVSARVVDVENGEICAMSRVSVQKDDYVNAHINDKPAPKPQPVPQAKPTTETTTVATTIEVATAATTAQPAEERPKEKEKEKTTTKVLSSSWTVQKTRDDIAKRTIYSFITTGVDNKILFLGYEKYDNPIQSKVRVAIKLLYNAYQHEYAGNYGIKGDSGSATTLNLSYMGWSYKRGECSDGDRFGTASGNISAHRELFEFMLKNDYLLIRRGTGTAVRFQTTGLLTTLEKEGLTRDEILTAIANEEF